MSGADRGRARVRAAAGVLTERLGAVPATAVVLGSGLGPFADQLDSPVMVPSDAIPGWPRPTVAGHAGRIVAGSVAGARLLAVAGRVHLYEGYSPAAVTFGIRTLALAGVRRLILTNAAGGINPAFGTGTLMVVDDHINFTGINPLVGPNDHRLGTRFPDMSEVYSRQLRRIADEAAAAAGIPLAHGVYIGVVGPSYETPAEIRAFRAWGADAVGMSTVCEAIVARQMGMEVLGLSCIANPAAGLNPAPLSEDDVLEAAARTAGTFGRLLEGIVARL